MQSLKIENSEFEVFKKKCNLFAKLGKESSIFYIYKKNLKI